MNNDDIGRFWRERVAARGHTGWANDIVYAWDQHERLELVMQTVRATDTGGRTALDFGAGSGDLSRRLLRDGWWVAGYDPFVDVPVRDERFVQVRALTELAFPVDLITSVTVLDHVLDDVQFGATLADLRRACRPDGRMVAVEYALDDDDDWEPASSYQAWRRMSAWRSALRDAGWQIERVDPMPHPQRSPSPGWSRYVNAATTRTLQRRVRGRARPLALAANATLLRWRAPAPACTTTSSPLKRFLCRPATGRRS